jgi:hypothetical protein
MRKFTKDWLISWVRELPKNITSFARVLEDGGVDKLWPIGAPNETFPFNFIARKAYLQGRYEGYVDGYKSAGHYVSRMVRTWIDDEEPN